MPNKQDKEDFSLKIFKISKDFINKDKKNFVLDSVSFNLTKGKIISIVGNSGCGKTTLLNILAGVINQNSGEVEVRGTIAYVPQKDLLLSWRSVMENILLPVEIDSSCDKEIIKKARRLLKENNLDKFSNYFPKEISGGMKQKVSLIRSYVQNADIFLCDEPFSAIDFGSRQKLAKEFRTYIKNTKKSALFVTHNVEEAIVVGDEIIALGEKPSRITYRAEISIGEKDRDVLSIRKNSLYEKIFEKTWQAMNK